MAVRLWWPRRPDQVACPPHKRVLRTAAFLVTSFACASAHAELSPEDLAKIAQNPVGNLISVPFQENANLNVGPLDRTQNVLNIQPVFPINLNSDWNIITRTILPIISQPAFAPGQSRTNGIGDVQFNAFLSPANNIWSVGNSSSPAYNNGLVQLFLNYNFESGLYFTSSPISTVNWQAKGSQQWTVPMGGGLGKILKLGKLPVNTSLSAYYNVVRPDFAGNWQIRAQVQFLLPK
jgi:hypothetical protein